MFQNSHAAKYFKNKVNKNAFQWDAYRTLVGVPAQGGVPAGGCTCLGVPAQVVFLPAGYLPEGYLPGGCNCPGGVPAWVVYLPRRVYMPSGVPAQVLPPVNRITGVKT